MANSYHQIYIQAVFVVKYRDAVIEKSWRPKLLGVIGQLINETGCKTILVNGVEDHVHCFFGLKPSVSLSDVMQAVKGRSSKFINDQGLIPVRFEWQEGYGAFSYSHSHVDKVYRYIENQDAHHQTQDFNSEYLGYLNKFEIPYDERYLFHSLV